MRPSHFFSIFSLLLMLLQAAPSFAWQPTFGKEFNFTNAEIKAAFAERAKQKDANPLWELPKEAEQLFATKFSERVKELCKDECKITPHPGKHPGTTDYTVKFKNGWGFNISTDPKVVEIQTLPETAAKVAQNQENYRIYVFEAAKLAELTPTPEGRKPKAHLNIGFRSAFGNDPVKFMRFFIDYATYSGLSTGALGESNDKNSPLLGSLKEEQLVAFQKIIDDVNSGQIKTADEATWRINHEVYTFSPGHEKDIDPTRSYRHYQAFGLKQMLTDEFKKHDMPFEFRRIRQDSDASQYPLLAKLMEKRLAFTNGQKNKLLFDRAGAISRKDDLSSISTEFYVYTTEMGENWKDYESLVSPMVKKRLDSGLIQKVFSKNVDLSNPYEKEIFENYLVKNPLHSEWVEGIYGKILFSKAYSPDDFMRLINDATESLPADPSKAWRLLRAYDQLNEAEKQNVTVGKTSLIQALREKAPPVPEPELAPEMEARAENPSEARKNKASFLSRIVTCATQGLRSFLGISTGDP